MIQRVKVILRQFFLSIEIILVAAAILTFLIFPKIFGSLTHFLESNQLMRHTFYVPVACFAYSIRVFGELVQPDHKAYNQLVQWEGYQELKDTTYIGIFFILSGLLITSYLSFIETDLSHNVVGILIIIGYLLTSISTLSIFAAQYKLPEILERHTS